MQIIAAIANLRSKAPIIINAISNVYEYFFHNFKTFFTKSPPNHLKLIKQIELLNLIISQYLNITIYK